MKHRKVSRVLLLSTLLVSAIGDGQCQVSAIEDPDDVSPGLPDGRSARLSFSGPSLDLSDRSLAVRAAQININEGRGLMDLGFGDGSVSFEKAQGESRSSVPVGDMGIAPAMGFRLEF